MRDNKFSKEVRILNGRCYECNCEKDYGDNFPFDIERLPSDSDDYYKGYCKGMEMLFDLAKRGDLADKGIIYDEYYEDECGECEDCPCFNSGFDMGFRQGSKIAREELMDDIYIDGYKETANEKTISVAIVLLIFFNNSIVYCLTSTYKKY